MSDLKPLGSEKLNGDEKLKRILELTYYNTNKKTQSAKAELVKESKNGGVYAIVKEKDSYYVKQGLNESSLDYIGGMYMKNKNKFSSYAEALKRLELIKGQEELINETKYLLKKSKDTDEAASQAAMPPAPKEAPALPAPAPDDMGGAPADDMGGQPAPDDMGGAPDADAAPDANMGNDKGEQGADDEYEYMGQIHKFCGKLQEELRKQDKKLESKDIKWVLNMIISSLDLDKLEDKDLEEIADKFDRDEIHDGDKGGEEETPAEPSGEEPSSDEEIGEEYDAMKALEEFVDGPMDETDMSEYLPEEKHEHDEEMTIDLDEIKKDINDSINQALHKYFK